MPAFLPSLWAARAGCHRFRRAGMEILCTDAARFHCPPSAGRRQDAAAGRFLFLAGKGESMSIAKPDDASVADVAGSHFFDMALRGRYPAASGVEQRARKLALVIAREAPWLSAEAIKGLHLFIDCTTAMPDTAHDLLGE